MATKAQDEKNATLRNDFKELNICLHNSYDEDDLPLFRDLIIEYIFIERPDISSLPWTEVYSVRHALAEELSTKFMKAHADTLWDFRDLTPDAEEVLKLSVEGFMMAVFDIEANKWEVRDNLLVLVENLTIEWPHDKTRKWLEDLPPLDGLDEVAVEESGEVTENDEAERMTWETSEEKMREMGVQDSDDQSTPAEGESHVNKDEPKEGGASTS